MNTQVFSKVLAGIYGPELTRDEWPIMLTLSITNRCNLRCCMCTSHSNDIAHAPNEDIDMPEELFLKIEPLIGRAHCISLSGDGEPTLAGHFLQRARRIRQLNPHAYLVIYTNGVLLSSLEFAEEMVPLFDRIYLSLNGTKSYPKISGGHSFENIKRALENIKLVRKRLDKPCELVIGFILMKKNLQDIVEAAVLAREMEADRIWYRDLWGCNDIMKSESARHNPELASLMLEKVQKASQLGITVQCDLWPLLLKRNTKSFSPKPKSGQWDFAKIQNQPLTDTLRIFRRKHKIDFKGFSFPCYEPWETLRIFQNGRAYLCCNGNRLAFIGNLRKKSFAEIWFGDEARRYREGMITGHYYKACSRCRFIFRDDPGSYEGDIESSPRRNFIKRWFSCL